MKVKYMIAIAVGLALFIAFLLLSVFSDVFKTMEIPIQVMGALLGAIVTAFITMMLLYGQSQAEELKEKNVKVFEARTLNYTKFIDELWTIWEDRRVDLRESSKLLELVTKNIILYTKAETTKGILDELIKLTELAQLNEYTTEQKIAMQDSVFKIVNLLASEMGLGGKIGKAEQATINKIENMIEPYLQAQEFKNRLISDINKYIEQQQNLNLSSADYMWIDDNEYIGIDIPNTGIKLIFGSVSNKNADYTIIGLFSEYYANRQYYDYRNASKGWRKDYLGQFWWNGAQNVDPICFNNKESVDKLIKKYKDAKDDSNPGVVIASEMIRYIKEWRHNDLDIYQVIEVCSKKTPA